MKTFVLALLFLGSLCFALGEEEKKDENDFIDVDADEAELPDDEQQPEEDEEENMEDLEDEEDIQEDEESDEPEDPQGFKDDLPEDLPEDVEAPKVDDSLKDAAMKEKNIGRPIRPPPKKVDTIVEPNPPKPTEEPGSGSEPNNDADLKPLEEKLGLK